jgi:hypothetical protein
VLIVQYGNNMPNGSNKYFHNNQQQKREEAMTRVEDNANDAKSMTKRRITTI